MFDLSFTPTPRHKTARTLKGFGLLAILAINTACTTPTYPTQPQISLPREAPRAVPLSQSRAMYARNPELRSCNKYQQAYVDAGWPTGDNLSTVKKIDRMVRERFNYRREAIDIWDAHSKTLLFTHEHFEGDCDDIAATVLAMSLCAGVPRSRLGFVITSSDWDDELAVSDHVLGFYKARDGQFYSLGDTKRATSPLNHSLDRISHWQYLDRTGLWNRNDSRTNVKIHVSEQQ